MSCNSSSVQRIVFVCIIALFLFMAVSGRAETSLEVSVTGIDGRLYDNVMARLRIARFSLESELNETEIRRLHSLAAADIGDALAPFGYYSATVTPMLQATEAGWLATYRVELGEPVRVDMVSVRIDGAGSGLPEFADPGRFIDLPPGAVLAHRAYEDGKRDLLRYARSLGFLDAVFTVHEIRLSRADNLAEVELVLDTGQRFLFGEVSADQDIITDELLDRFIPFAPGDYYSPPLLLELQRGLYRTDFFGMVAVDGHTDRADGRSVPVSIELDPLETYNRFSFGIGYATDIRAHVRFEWMNRLLNQYGHRADLSVLVGERESYSLVGYRIPISDPRFNSLGTSVLWNREEWEDTVSSLYSGGVSYEYRSARRWYGVSLEVLSEDYRIGATKDSSVLLMPGVQGGWIIADDVIDTGNGIRTAVAVHGASEQLVSDASFLLLRGDGRLILSPLVNWRLIGRGSAGMILVDSIDDIPPSQRFYAGGGESVRGYEYRTLGPRDSEGNVVGGTYLLTGGVELERRLSDLWRAAAFYDTGNAFDDFSIDFAHAIGIGIGLNLPFGQARLDLAYPIRDIGSAQYISIRVGADL